MSNSVYPPQHVYFSENEHETTVIFLHDRNSTGPKLADHLAKSTSPSGKTFYEHFQNTRWVFPSARGGSFYWTEADRRRLAQDNKDNTTDWFKLASLENVQLKSPPTILEDSVKYIIRIIDNEIERIKRVGGGSEKVFIAGMGQGAALGLVVQLCVHQEPGVYVGMDGRMPFAQTLSGLLKQNQIDEAGKFFESTLSPAQENQQQARTAHPPPSGTQPVYQPAETGVAAATLTVPEHVKRMPVFLGRSQLGEPELVAETVSFLEGIEFCPEHLSKEEEASEHDDTAVFPITPELVEKLVDFFKKLNVTG
jgi:predicted esterase